MLVDAWRCVVGDRSTFECGDSGADVAVVAREAHPILEAGRRRRRIGVAVDEVQHRDAGIGEPSAVLSVLGPAHEHHLSHRGLRPMVAGTGSRCRAP